VSAAEAAAPISAAEATKLFHLLTRARAVVLAVSGGPDSTALLVLAARWRAARKRGPKLLAVTIDHGLRSQSAREARAVAKLARSLGVPHRILRWRARKPETGLQEAAREARYRLLADAARAARADHILTAHTLDDQAETVLMRMTRGSGITGLAAMKTITALPITPSSRRPRRALLVRPFLEIPKARLVATLRRDAIEYAEDASNRDQRFARARMRELMSALAREGLDAGRIALLARRLARADSALEQAVDVAATEVSQDHWHEPGPITFDAERFFHLPAEIALRLLGRAIARVGDGAALRLGKLEALFEALAASTDLPSHREGRSSDPCLPPRTKDMDARNKSRHSGAVVRGDKRDQRRFRLRRTLADALVTLTARWLVVDRAPARAGRPSGRNIRKKGVSLGRRSRGN
jgi:tRNA(Ile)-lysidine synthase